MRSLAKNMLIPAIAVGLVAAQTIGLDADRMSHISGWEYELADTTATPDSFAIEEAELPEIPAPKKEDDDIPVVLDTLDTLDLIDRALAKDTVFEYVLLLDRTWPDSLAYDKDLEFSPEEIYIAPPLLKYTDSLRYALYIALKDTTTRYALRDTLIARGDSVRLAQLDSLYLLDSTEVAKWKYDRWYESLSRKERRKVDYELALPGKIHRADSILHRKDSIKAYKDSVRENTPRILETFAIPDSLQYRRLITWNVDGKFNDIKIKELDTSYNYHFYDFPARKNDVNMSYLGVSGSPVQTYNYFKRDAEDNAFFYTPYRSWSYDQSTLPQFNTKTYYTELAYWGTLFAKREKEESNIRVRTTQNITPALNINLEYSRYGGNGMLQNESVNNRTAVVSANYLGRKYLMHTGYVFNSIRRNENGGALEIDPYTNINMLRDTTVDSREVKTHLSEAGNTVLKKHLVYLDQSYRIPLSFGKKKKAAEEGAEADTLSIDRDVTTAFIGHSSELAVFNKHYTDNISSSDTYARELFHNNFFLNPTKSNDSMRVLRLDNKVYMRLQPWKDDAIISKIDVGIGDKFVSTYSMNPMSFLSKGKNNFKENSLYVYAGAKGQYKQYFNWDANGKYNFLGAEINDFGVDANIYANFFPFRRYKTSPLTLEAHFSTDLKEPEYYQKHMFINHYRWDNDFSKISTTKVRAGLSIPRWKLSADFGYALLANNIYYDTESMVRQNTDPMSVISATLYKEFVLWKFHLDHKLMFQYSSNEEVMSLPIFSANLRYFFQFTVVKNVMDMQIGANAWFDTKWYAPAFDPALGVFHNQNDYKYGTTPYIDVFVNIQWKNACIFLKCENVNMGWPMDSKDYFSAHNYIRPQRSFKLGIFWPFYVHNVGHNGQVKGSSGGGGGRSGGGGGMTSTFR